MIPLPSPKSIKKKFELSSQAAYFITEARKTGIDILAGKDPRKAFIVGPCSIHDPTSTLEYAHRLQQLAKEVESSCFLVLRVYVEKSRTSTGWKGFLYDPHLDGSCDLLAGLLLTRQLLVTLAEMQIPCATEFVDPLTSPYFEDLISWGFIGARTASSQVHRQLASSLAMPVGFKNCIEGNIENSIHGMKCAAETHTFFSATQEGQLSALRSLGNPHTHIVLRGSCQGPNYDVRSVQNTLQALQNHNLKERLMIDCSHGNARKDEEKQQEVFFSALEQIDKGNKAIIGLMLESHLEKGNQLLTQDPSDLKYAVSITDPCLDWNTTQTLIQEAHSVLSPVEIVC
jgi:3-deoxy-7-phosphoheptulonate synthase